MGKPFYNSTIAPLSPELISIQQVSDNIKVHLDEECYQERYFAIFALVREAIMNQQSVLVLIEQSDIELVKEAIKHYGLDDYTLLTDGSPLTEKDWYKLKSYTRFKKVKDDRINTALRQYDFNKIKNSLLDSYKLSKQPLFGSKSIEELKELAFKANEAFSYKYLKNRINFFDFVFDTKEFWVLKSVIEEASLLSPDTFPSLEYKGLLKDEFCLGVASEQDINDVILSLDFLRSSAEDIVNDLYEFKSNFVREQSKRYVLCIEKHMASLNLLKEQIDKERISEPNTPSSGFFKKNNSKKNITNYLSRFSSIIKDIKSDNITSLDTINQYKLVATSTDEIQAQLCHALEDLLHLKKNTNSIINNEFNRLNSQNTSFERLPEILGKQEELLKTLNDLEIGENNYECNTIGLYETIKYYEDLIVELDKIKYVLANYTNYIFYRAFYTDQDDHSKYLIDALGNLPKTQWINAFISWYLSEIVEGYEFDYEKHNSLLTSYKSMRARERVEEQVIIKTKWQNNVVEALNLLKSNNKKAYNEIVKKSTSPNSLKVLLKEKIIQPIFPITVKYRSNKLGPEFSHKDWDVLYNCQNDNKNLIDHNNMKVFGNYPDAKYKVNGNYKINFDFSKMTNSQLLLPVTELSNRLTKLNKNLSFYSFKEGFVVSTIQNNMEDILNNYFPAIQVYNNSLNPLDNMIDVLLASGSDKKQYLLIKNGLLDGNTASNTIGNIDWQHYIVDSYKMAGFIILEYNDMIKLSEGSLTSTKSEFSYEVN